MKFIHPKEILVRNAAFCTPDHAQKHIELVLEVTIVGRGCQGSAFDLQKR